MPGKLFWGGVCQTCTSFSEFWKGSGLEQNRVYHAEDRGIGPNAKSQYDYRNNSEGGRFAQHPEAEAKILYQGFHNSSHS